MELLLILFALVVIVVHCFRWIIIVLMVVIGMASGGFFVGLGVGVCTYFVLKLSKWILFIIGFAEITRRNSGENTDE